MGSHGKKKKLYIVFEYEQNISDFKNQVTTNYFIRLAYQ